ncbi:MAG: helix-turn-helix domain-containing protein [Zhenhengia sp.]|uniref:Helix-turn-helix transcriptional regulator n=1 Tax=Zhenhengia yiwuensis TaxID=2763666 RepID=A0A926EK41_9FIRM|nr:helix-turn-helix transcriptional regulator [Zhenhengia yiwuensis]MBC8579990.1 helix-turn-helix transcriptional regulator [Zhenhengia yiwuensis]
MKKNQMWVCAGEKLRELRKEKNLSVHKVGRQLGVSGNYISLIERGKTLPGESMLIGLAEFYDIDKQELFDMYGRIESEQVPNIIALPSSIRKTLNQISKDKSLSNEEIDEAIQALREMAEHLAKEKER